MLDKKSSLVDESTPRKKPDSAGEDKPKEKRALLKHWLIYALKFLGILIIIEVVEEFFGALTGRFIWNALPKAWAAAVGIAGIIFSGFFSAFTDENRKAFFSMITRPDKMNSWEHALDLLKRVWVRYICHNTLIFIIICFAIALCLPAYCANVGVTRRVLNASSQGLKFAAEIFTPYSLKSGNTDDDSAPSLETPAAPPSHSQPFDEGATAASSAATDTPSEASKPTLESLSVRLLLLPGMNYEVSEEERSEVLFQTGKYAIATEDWDNNNIILSNVRSFVDAQRKLHRKSSYTESELSSSDSADINSATMVEKKMLEDKDPTSDQLREVIDKRETAYHSFPFYSLATLIRENFCMYGDAIHMQGGDRADAATLFMKSILYGFETLQYDVSTIAFVNDLEILSERFLKLSNVLTPNSDEARYASHLAEAFQTLSKEFS